MDKESIFLSCIIILMIFEIGYYIKNPLSVWNLEIGTVTGVIVVGVATGIVVGLNVAASGENPFGARLIFICATLFCILFQFTIPQTSINTSDTLGNTIYNTLAGLGFSQYQTQTTTAIPIGIGLFYPNMTNVFLTGLNDPLHMFGMILVSTLMFITLITGLMIASGDHG